MTAKNQEPKIQTNFKVLSLSTTSYGLLMQKKQCILFFSKHLTKYLMISPMGKIDVARAKKVRFVTLEQPFSLKASCPVGSSPQQSVLFPVSITINMYNTPFITVSQSRGKRTVACAWSGKSSTLRFFIFKEKYTSGHVSLDYSETCEELCTWPSLSPFFQSLLMTDENTEDILTKSSGDKVKMSS